MPQSMTHTASGASFGTGISGSRTGWIVAFFLAATLLVQVAFPYVPGQEQAPVTDWRGNSGSLIQTR